MYFWIAKYTHIHCSCNVSIISGNQVMGDNVTSCENAISIKCVPFKIALISINTTSNLGIELINECNAHHECNVNNTVNECVHVHYWCKIGK